MSFDPNLPQDEYQSPVLAEVVRPDRVVLMLFGLMLLAVMFFVIGVAFGVRGDDITILALAMVTAMLSAVPLAIDQGRPYPERQVFMSLLAAIFILYFATK